MALVKHGVAWNPVGGRTLPKRRTVLRAMALLGASIDPAFARGLGLRLQRRRRSSTVLTKFFLMILLVLTLTASGALAAAIASAPVSGLAIGVSCICSVTNTSSTRAIDVVVDILNGNGSIADTASFSIPPLGTVNNLDAACGLSNPHWCRVSGRFPKKKVRAIYCVRDASDIASATCSELQ